MEKGKPYFKNGDSLSGSAFDEVRQQISAKTSDTGCQHIKIISVIQLSFGDFGIFLPSGNHHCCFWTLQAASFFIVYLCCL